jgi:hypothetical protein
MEEFLIGQHPVATYLVACALGMFVVWCLKQWSERRGRELHVPIENYETGPDPVHGLDAPHPDWRCDYSKAAKKKKKKRRK